MYFYKYTLIQCMLYISNIGTYVSRHTVVCRAAQEAGAPHREYIDRKKENVIFTLCISVMAYPIETKFAAELPAS